MSPPPPRTLVRPGPLRRNWELLAAALLTLCCVACFVADRLASAEADADIQRNAEVTILSERLLSAVKDVETGQRGFLLTGDEAYLAPFNAALPTLQTQLAALRALGLPLDDVPTLIDARVASAQAGIAIRRAQGLDGAVAAITAGRGKDLMDAVRSEVQRVQQAAQDRVLRLQRHTNDVAIWLTVGSVLALAGAVGAVAAFAARRRREAVALGRRIRDSEARFRNLAENSAAIIWTTAADGRFEAEQRQWNAFTGQAAGESLGDGWAASIHRDDRDEAVRAWSHAVATHEPYVTEHRLRRADGEWRHMAVLGVPVLDEDGAVKEWVGSHTDITERRHAEEALASAKDAAEAANRSKSTFLANMSHELRTPLSAVIGYAEMLEEEVEDLGQPHLLADLKKIETNARHLLSLINDVLDLSKIEANKMTSYAEDFDVAALARDAAGTVDALVQKKSNTLRVDLAPDLGTMHSDVVKLRQCLFNLISNAAKFTENGSIVLSVRRDGEWMEFRVADTGIGMTEEQLGRLFRRFEQADDSTTRNFGGTGLGLALTRAFCRLLGGTIAVESRVREGTAFILRLPATMPEQGPGPAAEQAVADPTSGKQVVLVVDDDAAQRELLTRFLEREGFAVRSATNGRAGLELARAIRPRAILLDVMMPQMDGWSVLTALKADPDVAGIPVVMASFINEPAMANALGAADYLIKPVEWEQLKSVMQRFLATEGSVLVVDDDADARSRLRTVLERQGWVVAEAGNGEEALSRVAEHAPQLILLDLTMPVMDGFTFLHALRATPGGADIAVVVLSARDLSKDDRARLEGADRVLRKGDVDLRTLPGQLAEFRLAEE